MRFTITFDDGKALTIDVSGPIHLTVKNGSPSPAESIALPQIPMRHEHWKALSPMEESLIKVATKEEWQSAERLIERAGISDEREAKSILRNLVAKNILQSAPSRGYKLYVPEELESDV